MVLVPVHGPELSHTPHQVQAVWPERMPLGHNSMDHQEEVAGYSERYTLPASLRPGKTKMNR